MFIIQKYDIYYTLLYYYIKILHINYITKQYWL